MSVHFQGCTGLFQHGGGRRFFMEAAVFVGVTVYGLQENLVDDGSCGLSVRVLDLVGVYMVCLRDSTLLQRVELLQLVRWSVERRNNMNAWINVSPN